MTVVFTAEAAADLDEIWRWNARQRGIANADAYVSFLRREIDGLVVNHAHGSAVPARPGCRYLIVRRKPRGHGHLVVYEMIGTTISVVQIFHTAQDWQRRLSSP